MLYGIDYLDNLSKMYSKLDTSILKVGRPLLIVWAKIFVLSGKWAQ